MIVDLTGATWRKSSRSGNNGGACLEVAGLDRPLWTKSSRSGNNGGECVEVATDARVVAARDSKCPTGPALPFVATAWTAFLDEVRTSQIDR